MEILKQSINLNRICGKSVVQQTASDDLNVPDAKPDIEKIITYTGEIIIESIKPSEGRVLVGGRLRVNILYKTDKGRTDYEGFSGEVPFSESVNIPGIDADDTAKCNPLLEDLKVTLINSRKVSIMAMVSLEVYAERTGVTPAAVNTDEGDVCVRKKNMQYLSLLENKRDILRVRETRQLPSGKPNMGRIIWSDANVRNVETRANDDKLTVKGEMSVFIMYASEDRQETLDYLEETLPFVGTVPLPGADDSMIAHVTVVPTQKNVSIKPDNDGEPRNLEAEMLFDLDIKLYEEKSLAVIEDMYSLKKELKPVFTEAGYDSLLIHNHSRCRVNEKVTMSEKARPVLQIIHTSATIGIDDIIKESDGLMVEGAATVSVLYISSNDKEGLVNVEREVPFSHKIDAADITDDSFYTIKTCVEQLSAGMASGDELEVRLVVGMDALVLKPGRANVITDVEECDYDMKLIRKLPGIWGHIITENDSLWSIAKEHHTTVEKIIETNGLAAENVKPGTKIIIIKEAV